MHEPRTKSLQFSCYERCIRFGFVMVITNNRRFIFIIYLQSMYGLRYGSEVRTVPPTQSQYVTNETCCIDFNRAFCCCIVYGCNESMIFAITLVTTASQILRSKIMTFVDVASKIWWDWFGGDGAQKLETEWAESRCQRIWMEIWWSKRIETF